MELHVDERDAELAALRRENELLRARDVAAAVQRELLGHVVLMARTDPEGPTLDNTLQHMLDAATRLSGAMRGALFVLDADGTVTNSILTRAEATTEQRRAIIGSVMRHGLAGWVATRREPGLIADTLSDERWITLPYEPYSVRSALALPIERGDTLLGVLTLLHGEPGYFDDAHVRLLQLTADQMALALDSARLYGALQQELAQRRRAELALRQANAELAEATEQLKRWMEARAQETSSAVHDMRHGVRDVLSAHELLALDLADARVPLALFQPGIRRADAALDALQELLGDMLDAALLQSNALALDPQPTDLAALVDAVAQRLAPRYHLLECTLAIRADEALPPVLCDKRRVARVLYNLLHNAAQYSADQEDPAAMGAVEVSLAREGESVACRISDNGRGIAPGELQRLGTRFARVASGAGSPEGSGLGLNFCIGILRLLGGGFALSSPGVGKGATATITLPQAR